ncbi:MAG: 4Fe-4S binding protein [Firmicutes bacterium]|jgi:NADH-quinone oxidoreductase subunit G/NADP-reducing hydrogenase subunit HndD|nr:4Fe-4S binding protein [Bacillota bacterium]
MEPVRNGTTVTDGLTKRKPVTINVDGRDVEVDANKSLLYALREVGVRVPTLCHWDGLREVGACRLCVVEVEGSRTLVASCTQPVSEGMIVRTQTPRIRRARKVILELILANHPEDCLYCQRNGECELQDLAAEYGVDRRFRGQRQLAKCDETSFSLVRDAEKCVLCQRCVSVCDDIQSVAAITPLKRGFDTYIGVAFGSGIGESECVNCGQCTRVCPTSALVERDDTCLVYEALADPNRHVVAQIAPAVRVSVAQAFGMDPGTNFEGQLVAGLKKLGFDKVFDTNFTADLTIMEEAAEFVGRVKNGGPFPLVTSCCPAWIKFAEEYYPDRVHHLSSCKSPQMMMGALLRSEYAHASGASKEDSFVVSFMPCTAKKWELTEVSPGDVNVVLTTRELIRMFKREYIDLASLEPMPFDRVLGDYTGAAVIFGASGGVAEAALRTAYHMVTGEELADPDFEEVRGLEGVKTTEVDVNGITLKVAVLSGLRNVRNFFDQGGWENYHLIEVMACPGGCINGGGQPYGEGWPLDRLMKSLYLIDKNLPRRRSHENPEIKMLYEKYLGEPNSEEAHRLLHREYKDRSYVLMPPRVG